MSRSLFGLGLPFNIALAIAKYVRESRSMSYDEWSWLTRGQRAALVRGALQEKGLAFFENIVRENSITAVEGR